MHSHHHDHDHHHGHSHGGSPRREHKLLFAFGLTTITMFAEAIGGWISGSLALLADGQGGALLSWSGITAEGRMFGWWKDRLDRRFIQQHMGQH